jgi:2-amino-4-hydroxy-6-hydroxymethyldihydropteridine diphosphokinase
MTRVHVGVGSNVDRERNIRSGLASLAAAFGPLRVSRVFESVAVGFVGDPFFNLVVSFETDLPAAAVAARLREIEFAHGRPARAVKLAPRTLDLDLLLYGDVREFTESHQLPREDVTRFAYVLWPLAELDGELRHPVDGRTYREIWAEFPRASAPGLAPVDFVAFPAPAVPSCDPADAVPAVTVTALPAVSDPSVPDPVPRPESPDASGLFR